jgi:hypothetical protein
MSDYDMRKSLKEHLVEDAKKREEEIRKAAEEITEKNKGILQKLRDSDEPCMLTLPTDSTARKGYPILSGCLKYFPAAIAGVSNTSKLGNDKHNPGQELHHSRSKSSDHGDCIVRHLIDTEDLLAAAARGDGRASKEAILIEVNQMVWRALAYSQLVHEKYGAPMAPAAKG